MDGILKGTLKCKLGSFEFRIDIIMEVLTKKV
jgi:hypothetical protein